MYITMNENETTVAPAVEDAPVEEVAAEEAPADAPVEEAPAAE